MNATLDLFRETLAPENPDVTAERARVREFLADATESGLMTPSCDSWMAGHSPAFSRELGRRGWIGMTWPRRYGGRETTPAARFAVIEELLAAGAPVAAHWFADRQIGPSLLRHGTDRQREFFLPQMARGELYFSIGMSEPESGSDLGSVRTRAVPAREGWRVTGSKIWTSHAQHSQHLLALVRTGEPGERNPTALTQLIIDLAQPGVTIRPIRTLDRQEHFCEVFLDDVAVPPDRVLGTPGAGWRQVMGELGFERSGPERFLSTFPLLARLAHGGADDPDFGRLVARLVVLRAMSARVSSHLGDAEAPGVAAAVVKDLGTAFEHDTLDVAAQQRHGHPDTGLTPLLDQARLQSPGFTLRGGASEIMREIIARAEGLS